MPQITIPNDPWISVPKAAAIVGIHRQTISKYAASGELKYQMVAGNMVIDRVSAERLRKKLDKAASKDAVA